MSYSTTLALVSAVPLTLNHDLASKFSIYLSNKVKSALQINLMLNDCVPGISHSYFQKHNK